MIFFGLHAQLEPSRHRCYCYLSTHTHTHTRTVSFDLAQSRASVCPSHHLNASQGSRYHRKRMSTTSPHAAVMTAQHTPSQTPSRRVLGDLTPIVANTSSETTRDPSPLKRVTSHLPSVFAEKENFTASNTYLKGRKRSIDEVDDAEKVQGTKMLARDHDQTPADPEVRLTAAAVLQHTVRLAPSSMRLHVTNKPGKQPNRPGRPWITHRAQFLT